MSLSLSVHCNSTLSEIKAGNQQLGVKGVSATNLNWGEDSQLRNKATTLLIVAIVMI